MAHLFYRMTTVCGLVFLTWACDMAPASPGEASPGSVAVTFSEGTNMAVALSPDHTTVVFDLLGRLWMMPFKGGTPHPLTDAYGNARLPQWSADGKTILFQAYWSGTWQIYTINRDGTQLEQWTDGPYDHREPVWGPDAHTIYYASDATGNYDIWKLDMKTRAKQNITQQPFAQFSPAWHPVSGLSYLSDDPDNPGIFQLEDGQLSVLYTSDATLGALSWNTNGSWLSFQENGTTRLLPYQQSDEGGGAVTLPDLGSDIFPFPLSWLDEHRFVYTGDGQIHIGNRGQGKTGSIPFKIELHLNRADYIPKSRNFDIVADSLPVKGIFMPRLSPDGAQVAMVLLQDLWLRTAQGQLLQLTNDPYVEMAPVWSPDGRKLAFLSDRGGSFAIYSMDLATKEVELLTTVGGSAAGLDWSPNGRKLAYSASYGPRMGRLFVYDLDIKELRQLGGMINSSLGAPSWSPDSRTIALSTLQPYSSRYREGVNSVLFVDAQNGSRRLLGGLPHFSVGTRAYNGPVWSPDGRFLAAISASRLWLIPIDGNYQLAGEPIPLTEYLADAPSWSADGQQLLYLATDHLERMQLANRATQQLPIQLQHKRKLPTGRQLIRVGYLFDGIHKQWQRNVDVVIGGHRILSVGPASAKNELDVDTIIDASDRYLIPGLIEGHAHQGSWDGEILGRTLLAWGVTASRDPASDPYDALQRKGAQEAGKVWGPRIFFTGSPFDGSRIYYGGANALQDSSQIALELERAKRLDYDLIKTYVRLSDPLQQKIIEAAHALGLPVSSHELYPAVGYGMDGLEHILGTSRRGYSPKMTRQNIAYEDVIQLIAASGLSFCPTTGIYVSYPYLLAQDSTLLEDPKVQALMPAFSQLSARQAIAQVRANPAQWEADFTNAMQLVKAVHDEGGWIVAGTDGPIIPFGFALHLELQAYAKAGIPPFEVLQTATINAAKVLHLQEELGSIEAGKLADLVLLNADPVQDMKNLMQIDAVMLNGVITDVADLLEGY